MALTPTFARSPHLVALVAEAERLAAVLRVAGADAPIVANLREHDLLATLRLDGSTIPAPPNDDDIALAEAHTDGFQIPVTARGSWADAMRTRSDILIEDARIWVREYAGAQRGDAADDLTAGLLSDFVPALATLHERLTLDLIAPGQAGRPRVTEQAVHDTSIGRVVYYPSTPAEVSRDLLHRPATKRLLETASLATGCRPKERIDRDHGLFQWGFPRLLAAVLDSPDHLAC